MTISFVKGIVFRSVDHEWSLRPYLSAGCTKRRILLRRGSAADHHHWLQSDYLHKIIRKEGDEKRALPKPKTNERCRPGWTCPETHVLLCFNLQRAEAAGSVRRNRVFLQRELVFLTVSHENTARLQFRKLKAARSHSSKWPLRENPL